MQQLWNTTIPQIEIKEQQFSASSTSTALLLLVNILIFEVASVISLGWFLEVSSPKQDLIIMMTIMISGIFRVVYHNKIINSYFGMFGRSQAA